MKNLRPTLLLGGIAFGLAGVLYGLQGNIRLDWADEGFLWYGARAILRGEVPMRDFQAYDPGRYYWSAAFLHFLGDRILALRLASTAFQGLGLFFALSALRRVCRSTAALAGLGAMAALWMVVHFRYYDAAMPMIAVFFATRYAERPGDRRALAMGMATGLAALVGVNHALYAGVAYGLLMLYRRPVMGIKGFSVFRSYGLGIGLGLLPILTAWIAVPGLFAAYGESMRHLLTLASQKSLSYRLPVLWPWVVNLPIGWAFVSVAVFAVGGSCSVLIRRDGALGKNPLFIASLCVGIAYLRHIFSRADVVYLGEGFFPVLAGLTALIFESKFSMGRWGKKALVLGLVLLTVSVPLSVNNLYVKLSSRQAWVLYPVGGDRLWLPEEDARLLDSVQQAVAHYVPENETLLMAPFLTTLYSVLNKPSPIWEIYFGAPQSEAAQRHMVRELERKNIRWAIAGDVMLRGSEDSRFLNSHPVLWEYLVQRFEAYPAPGIFNAHYFLKRKEVGKEETVH